MDAWRRDTLEVTTLGFNLDAGDPLSLHFAI